MFMSLFDDYLVLRLSEADMATRWAGRPLSQCL